MIRLEPLHVEGCVVAMPISQFGQMKMGMGCLPLRVPRPNGKAKGVGESAPVILSRRPAPHAGDFFINREELAAVAVEGVVQSQGSGGEANAAANVGIKQRTHSLNELRGIARIVDNFSLDARRDQVADCIEAAGDHRHPAAALPPR